MKSPWWGKEKRLKEEILVVLAEHLPNLHRLVGANLGQPLVIDEVMRAVITGYVPGHPGQAVFVEDVQSICVVLTKIATLLREEGVVGDGDGPAVFG